MNLPNEVSAKLVENKLYIKGPLGIKYVLTKKVQIEKDRILVKDPNTERLVKKMIQGVTTGFKLKLKIIGVGYKAQINQLTNNLELYLGYKNPIIKPIISDITIIITSNGTIIEGKSTSLERLSQYLSEIIQIRSGEKDVYKGKGVK
jgi:large subunit ribosomal protein L6